MNKTPIPQELKAMFLSLYHMVLCDDNVMQEELDELYKIGSERGLSEADINSILLEPQPDYTLDALPFEEKIAYLYNLTRIIYADSTVAEEEVDLLKRYINKLGFPAENVDAISKYFLDSYKENKTLETVISEINED